MPTKRTPPSVVRTIDVHGGEVHGALPSSHHVSSPIAVNELGANPAGTGPPAGTARAWLVGVVAGEVAVLVVGGDVAVLVE